MPLPPFNQAGDLPEGVHPATLAEIVARFGGGGEQRQEVTNRLERIYRLVAATGGLDRFVVFGSYVTTKSEPKDIDVVLVMRDDFDAAACRVEALALFDHRRAADELGASCFWVRPSMLFGEPLDRFIAGWGVRREGGWRGIVEVANDPG